MSINADDLPADVRKKLGLAAKTRTRKAPSRAGTGHAEPTPGHCGCGAPFTSYAAWERHAQAGCTRWNLDLGDPRRQAEAEETA